MREITLDARLARAFEMVPECRVCADIGADHGFLSAQLLMSGRVQRMHICDISAPSLDKARRLFAGDALESRAVFGVGDGLAPVDEPLDACVISGMGGETMIGIMRRGMDVIKHATLILQPNVDPDEVREFLYDNGFCVIDEDLIFDGKWWYFIIKAEPNVKAARPDDDTLMVGPVLIKNRHPLLPEYARRQVRILTKALAPMDESLARAAELRHKRAVWEEIANWQQ